MRGPIAPTTACPEAGYRACCRHRTDCDCGYRYRHVRAITVAVDQYAEKAPGNRNYFLDRPPVERLLPRAVSCALGDGDVSRGSQNGNTTRPSKGRVGCAGLTEGKAALSLRRVSPGRRVMPLQPQFQRAGLGRRCRLETVSVRTVSGLNGHTFPKSGLQMTVPS